MVTPSPTGAAGRVARSRKGRRANRRGARPVGAPLLGAGWMPVDAFRRCDGAQGRFHRDEFLFDTRNLSHKVPLMTKKSYTELEESQFDSDNLCRPESGANCFDKKNKPDHAAAPRRRPRAS
jgi:hypothetical protein